VDWVLLAFALLVILGGAQLFTNGVEWIGAGFGLSEGAVGSVLAAIGTALPETILPLVAILAGGREAGKDIGIGAILGAPLMLSTLAMVLVGSSCLSFARRGRSTDITPQPAVIRQDLGFFLGMYAMAIVAGLLDVKILDLALAAGLVVAYGLYVRRHFKAPGEEQLESEASGEVQPLYLRAVVRRLLGRPADRPQHPPTSASIVQTLVALALIVAGAKVFVTGIEDLASRFGVPNLIFALLVAPVATELPETFNSVLWVRRRKDTLAIGNVTGAMVFQSSFPVSVGLVFTRWHLTGDGLVAALIGLAAGASLYLTMRARGRLPARWLVAQGIFYVGFVIYVVATL
jgi:cation:H+ antiporter